MLVDVPLPSENLNYKILCIFMIYALYKLQLAASK